MCINNNNNKRINYDYGRHQDLIVLFKITRALASISSKFFNNLGTRRQKGSPALAQLM
jgi:hypothetical protein